MPSQSYTLLDIPGPRQTLRARASRRRGTRPRLSPASRHQRGADRLCRGARRPAAAERDSLARRRPRPAHADYLAWTEKATPQPGGVNLGEIIVWLREQPAADAILCNGAGNFSTWVHRFYRFRRFATHVAPISGSMGYGVPAAVGDEAAPSGAHGGVRRRRRRLPDERPGVRHRRAVRPADHRRRSATTASTAPSACTRSANIPAASSAPS